MKLVTNVFIVTLAAIGVSCASVYDYHYHAAADGTPDIECIAKRLARVLEPRGFERLTISDDEPIPLGGDVGHLGCPGASRPVVFLRERPGRAAVHLYACHGEARIVAIADGWGHDEPARTSRMLSMELSNELASGAVTLEHRYRLALE